MCDPVLWGGSLKAGRPWGWWAVAGVLSPFLDLAIPKSRGLEAATPKDYADPTRLSHTLGRAVPDLQFVVDEPVGAAQDPSCSQTSGNPRYTNE